MNKFLNVLREKRTLLIISCVEKLTGLVIFREEIASYVMPVKDR